MIFNYTQYIESQSLESLKFRIFQVYKKKLNKFDIRDLMIEEYNSIFDIRDSRFEISKFLPLFPSTSSNDPVYN